MKYLDADKTIILIKNADSSKIKKTCNNWIRRVFVFDEEKLWSLHWDDEKVVKPRFELISKSILKYCII